MSSYNSGRFEFRKTEQHITTWLVETRTDATWSKFKMLACNLQLLRLPTASYLSHYNTEIPIVYIVLKTLDII